MTETHTSSLVEPASSLRPPPDEHVRSSALLEDNPVEGAFLVFFSSTGSHNLSATLWEDLLITGTSVLKDAPPQPKPGWSVLAEERDEADTTADIKRESPEYKAIPTRVALLARKFALKDKFSLEDDARLAIASERVRQLLPAVMVHEYETLADVLATVKSVTEDDQTLRQSLKRAK